MSWASKVGSKCVSGPAPSPPPRAVPSRAAISAGLSRGLPAPVPALAGTLASAPAPAHALMPVPAPAPTSRDAVSSRVASSACLSRGPPTPTNVPTTVPAPAPAPTSRDAVSSSDTVSSRAAISACLECGPTSYVRFSRAGRIPYPPRPPPQTRLSPPQEIGLIVAIALMHLIDAGVSMPMSAYAIHMALERATEITPDMIAGFTRINFTKVLYYLSNCLQHSLRAYVDPFKLRNQAAMLPSIFDGALTSLIKEETTTTSHWFDRPVSISDDEATKIREQLESHEQKRLMREQVGRLSEIEKAKAHAYYVSVQASKEERTHGLLPFITSALQPGSLCYSVGIYCRLNTMPGCFDYFRENFFVHTDVVHDAEIKYLLMILSESIVHAVRKHYEKLGRGSDHSEDIAPTPPSREIIDNAILAFVGDSRAEVATERQPEKWVSYLRHLTESFCRSEWISDSLKRGGDS